MGETVTAQGVQLDGCLKKATSASKSVSFAPKRQCRLIRMQYPASKTNHLRWSNTHFERNWKQTLKKRSLGTDWWTKIDNFSFEICYPELVRNARHAIVEVDLNSENAKYLEAYPIPANQSFLFQWSRTMTHRIRKRNQHYNPFSKEKQECSGSDASSEESYNSADLAEYEVEDRSKPVELKPNEDEWSESTGEEADLGTIEDAPASVKVPTVKAPVAKAPAAKVSDAKASKAKAAKVKKLKVSSARGRGKKPVAPTGQKAAPTEQQPGSSGQQPGVALWRIETESEEQDRTDRAAGLKPISDELKEQKVVKVTAGPSGRQVMEVVEDEEAMQARVDLEGRLQLVEPIRADLGMDPNAIRKLKLIPRKKKGQKSLIPDSMRSTGPMPWDQSETSEQLMHRVIKIVAWVPIGKKNDYDQFQIPPEAYLYYVIFASNEATMNGVWLGYEALKNETDFEYF